MLNCARDHVYHKADFVTIFTVDNLHPRKLKQENPSPLSFESDLERSGEFWMEKGQSILKDLIGRKQNTNHAKNVS